MKTNNTILVSIVCYKNPEETIGFINSIKRQKDVSNIHIVVTSNYKEDYDEIINNIGKDIKCEVFLINENLGYLNNCLYGINNSKCKNTKFVMITNTDVEFIEEDYFSKLLSTKIDENVWCIGTNIININDNRQTNPLITDKTSKQLMKIKRTVFCNKLLYDIYNFYYYIRNKFTTKNNKEDIETKYVYAVHGSSFVLNRDCIDELSSLARNIFMYGEEELIAAFIEKYNKKVLYISELHVNHKGGSVTSKISDNKKFKHFKKSYNFIYDYLYNER